MSRRDPIVTILVAAAEDSPPGLEALSDRTEVRLADDADALREHLPGSDVLLVTDFRTDVLESAWDAADSLEWMHTTSAGVDAVLFPASIESDVVLTNARGIFDRSIAEYVLGVILAFAKDTRGNVELQREHTWKHRETERIDGRRVLVVGAGSIGGEISRLCRAVGMDVEGLARSAREDERFDAVHADHMLHDLLPSANFVVVAAPLTPETEGMIGARELALMNDGARLINVGRGPIVDTGALVDALRSGSIAGAGLDVFEEEPLPEDHPLWDLDNVLISAHMAGDFIGWQEALGEQFLENFRRWREGRELFNVVDKRRAAGAA